MPALTYDTRFIDEIPAVQAAYGSRAVSEDPRLSLPGVAAPQFKLQGIFYSEDHPSILIDGEFYSPGDQVEGYLIKAIYKQRVVVQKDGKSFQMNVER